MQTETMLEETPSLHTLLRLDLSALSGEMAIQLADDCTDCHTGLCQGVEFMGKMFAELAASNMREFSTESLCQLGNSLQAIGGLLPVLAQLQRKAECRVLLQGNGQM